MPRNSPFTSIVTIGGIVPPATGRTSMVMPWAMPVTESVAMMGWTWKRVTATPFTSPTASAITKTAGMVTVAGASIERIAVDRLITDPTERSSPRTSTTSIWPMLTSSSGAAWAARFRRFCVVAKSAAVAASATPPTTPTSSGRNQRPCREFRADTTPAILVPAILADIVRSTFFSAAGPLRGSRARSPPPPASRRRWTAHARRRDGRRGR